MLAIVTGRMGAESARVAWGVLVMTVVGFRTGGSPPFESSAYVPVVDDAGVDAGVRHQPADDADGEHGARPRRRPRDPAAARAPRLPLPRAVYLVPSLWWTIALVVVFAPLATWKLARS
jgi:hypothetical protein